MPETQHISEPEHLEFLKRQHGNNAQFISRDGFPFNAFDLVWQLDALGRHGTRVDTSWMLKMNYDASTHIDIRFALAGIAQRLASVSATSINQMLKSISPVDFSLPTIKWYWRTVVA